MQSLAASESWKWSASFLLGRDSSTMSSMDANSCRSVFPENMKLEHLNYYGLRTIMNVGKQTSYESILRMVDMSTLEHRCIEQSLIIFIKCFKEKWSRLCSQFVQTPSYTI